MELGRDIWDRVMMSISQAARVRDDEGDLAHQKGIGYFGYQDKDRMEVIGLPFLKEDQWRILWDCMREDGLKGFWWSRKLRCPIT